MHCCDECKIEPLTPGHYCECCGRKLSLQERRALETQAQDHHDHQAAPQSEDLPQHAQHDQPVDRLVGVHFQTPVVSAPVASVPSPGFIDPILEAHFAGQAPVAPLQETARVQPVAAATPVVPVAATRAAAASTDWVQPAVNVAPSGQAELFTDSTPADPPPHHDDGDSPGARCEVCGGPSDDHDLCPVCRETFQALLEPPPPVAVPQQLVVPASEQAVDDTSEQPAVANESAVEVAAVAPAVVSEPTSDVAVSDPVAAIEAAVTAPAVVAAPVVVPATVAAPAVAPTPAQAPVSPAIQIKVRPPVVFSSAQEASLATVDQAPPRPESAARAAAPKASASRPAPSKPEATSVASVQPASSTKKIAAVVAVAVALAAIGFPLGKLWLGHQETSPIVREQPQPEATPAPAPAPAAAPAPTVERVALPPSVPPAPPVVARAETAVPAPAAKSTPAANAAKPLVAPRATNVKPPVKTGRQPVAPPRPVAVTPVSSPVAAAPAPEVAPPPPVAAPEPKPEAPAAPIGPFFELRDVNETPRVVTRVEPQMPDDLRARQLNEVVIVRVLVTQAGHPMMVNLLRRSKAGASLDNAIVAAVKQWTFAPAKRRGEAVSCWYHVGVPVTQAN